MSTTDPTCTCGHAAMSHGAMMGCLDAACDCTRSRRQVQQQGDARATEQALANVEQGTDPVWLAAAEQAVRELAGKTRPGVTRHTGDGGFTTDRHSVPFTTDDVWDHLAAQGVEPPREPRALGPVMKRALSSGALKLEGYASSRRRHGSLIRSYTGA